MAVTHWRPCTGNTLCKLQWLITPGVISPAILLNVSQPWVWYRIEHKLCNHRHSCATTPPCLSLWNWTQMKFCVLIVFKFCLSPPTTVEASLMLVGYTWTYQSSGQTALANSQHNAFTAWLQSRKCVHAEPCGCQSRHFPCAHQNSHVPVLLSWHLHCIWIESSLPSWV